MITDCIKHKVIPAALILLYSSLTFGKEIAGPVTVAGITDEVPLEYTIGSPAAKGIYVELWKNWSGKTGIPVTYHIMKQEEALRALAKGSVDVIMGYESQGKDKRFLLSDTLYVSKIHIYSRENISSAETLSDLRPFIVGAISEDAEILKKSNPEITFIAKRTVKELIGSCEKGEINVFIAGSDTAGYELKNTGLWKKYTQSAEPVMAREIKASVPAVNGPLLELINKGFGKISPTEKLIISGTLSGGNIRYRISRGYALSVIVIIILVAGVAGFWIWNFQLKKKIELATRELQRMKDRAEAASRAKSRFLDNISHELRTPLTLILSPVEDALNDGSPGRNTLEMIRRNGRILLSLINDLLDLSRMTAGKMKLNISETDLGYEIKFYCSEMESAAARRGIEIKCMIPDEPVIAGIDTEKFFHILSNFFSNSFRFTEKGGTIAIGLKKETGNILLTFSDTGTGIPASKIDSVFNRFTQAETLSGAVNGGAGIGLAIVKEVAGLHGGTVSVESRHKQDFPDTHGTMFTVCIPSGTGHFIDRDDVVFIDAADGHEHLPFIRGIYDDNSDGESISWNNNLTAEEDKPAILVVEDNADMQIFLKKLLAENYLVYAASDGISALEVLHSNDSIDLVLSDVLMPGMDGHELMEKIHADERFTGLPVLFLTAVAEDFMKNEALQLGAVDYLVKPFNPDELKLRVRNQIRLRVMNNSLLKRNRELSGKLKSFVESRQPSLTEDAKKKMESICVFIKEHYTEDISREMISETLNMNPDIFSRMFNKYTGKSLPDYINSLRIDEAKKLLLETDITVSRLAIDTGYENIRTFNRAFKKITGMSPGEYREKGR